MKINRLVALLLCMVMVLSLSACNSGSTTTTETTEVTQAADAETQETTDTPAENTEAGTSEGGEKTIYVIVKVLGNQYWSVLQAGAENAGKELGCNVIIVGTAAESDIEGQVTLLQNAVSAQADGIIIGPVDSVSLANPVAEAYNSGIPVVLVDTTIDGDSYSAALLTDNVQAGRMAAEEMLAKLKEAGVSEDEDAQIAVQVGSTGSQTIIDRLAGFNEYWDANAPEKWVVLNDDIKVNDGDVSKAVGFGQDFLTTYPNLKGMFGPNNGSTVGFVTALTEANRTDVVMIGFDFSAEIEAMVRSGNFIVSSVVQKQYYMGYEGVKLALDLANGGTVSEKTIDTGVILVDSTNVDNAEVQEIINPT